MSITNKKNPKHVPKRCSFCGSTDTGRNPTTDCWICNSCGNVWEEEMIDDECSVCYGKGYTTDHHDPCTECGNLFKKMKGIKL